MALSLLDSRRSKNRSELNSSNRDKPDAFECNGLCRNQWMHSLLTFLTGCWPPFSHRFRPSGRYKNTKKSCQDLASNLVSFLNTRWFHSNHCMDRDMAQGHYATLTSSSCDPSRVARTTHVIYSCCNVDETCIVLQLRLIIKQCLYVSWYRVKNFERIVTSNDKSFIW